MNRRTTWGVVGFLAVAATLGIVWKPGPNSGEGSNPTRQSTSATPSEVEKPTSPDHDKGLVCDELAGTLQRFLGVEKLERPESCVGSPSATRIPLDLKFVIATLPDPIHTHLPLMFDRFAEVIQEAAQDEQFSYDSSWLPWDDKEQTYGVLVDEELASYRKGLRENQPGVLIFRNAAQSSEDQEKSKCASKVPDTGAALHSYQKGLIVFVVGEDPTSGIHIEQFNNALQWIGELKKLGNMPCAPMAILGPSFSGSFPSLAKLLSSAESKKDSLNDIRDTLATPLPIYSGSANGGDAIGKFRQNSDADAFLRELRIEFHGFLERDEVGLERYARYLVQEGYQPGSIAIISEDETTYGNLSGGGPETPYHVASADDTGCDDRNHVPLPCVNGALWLYYPRDISSLRAAYQSNSIFSNPAPQQPPGNVRGTLPSDLTDPQGVGHDTIRSYGGNQTTQSQEAYLLGLVEALREHHSQYVILRSTNVLDELFLAQYLRRNYAEARIVIDGSDRLFERERGTAGVGGTMSLSTYPLLSTERNWIDADETPPGLREFNSDLSEGTYIALRFLLHSQALSADPTQKPDSGTCILEPEIGQGTPVRFSNSGALPPLPAPCKTLTVPIPDYGTPSWMMPTNCYPETNSAHCDAAYRRPATWLSVLGRDGYSPIAAMNEKTTERGADRRPTKDEYHIKVPLVTKLWLIIVAVLVCSYLWCCWRASFTVKPAFRTYFAGPGDFEKPSDWRHPTLICLGSAFAAMLPLFAGWGCGVFDFRLARFSDVSPVLLVVFCELLVALGGVAANIRKVEKLQARNGGPPLSKNSFFNAAKWSGLAASGFVLFAALFALPGQASFKSANRFFTYYRSMNLLSGISPTVPFTVLALGMFAWFWYALHGLALFGSDRCCLPTSSDLKLPDSGKYLRMFSQEDAAQKTEDIAKPLSQEALVFSSVLLGVSAILFLFVLAAFHSPIRSLGTSYYAAFFFWCMFACFIVMLTEAWQLWRTWVRLKELLGYLDRLPLRRTIAALHGFSWGTVWGMSGNVLDVRYKLLSRQLESLGHARAALYSVEARDRFEPAQTYAAVRSCAASLTRLKRGIGDLSKLVPECLNALDLLRTGNSGIFMKSLDAARNRIAADNLLPMTPGGHDAACIEECISTLRDFLRSKAQNSNAAESLCILDLDDARTDGMAFAKSYADNYKNPDAGDFTTLAAFQKSAARAAATLLVYMLLPEWREETNSLVMKEPKPAGESGDASQNGLALPEKQHIRDAEEFVCLPYLGFVQNILGRMRTNVMSILFLFVAAALAISSYPFDPRPELAEAMLALFLVLGTVITLVYARMHRDSTLSHLTNTNPGELGPDFWLKIAAAGAAPVIGLLATFFPEIANFLSNWLQPGLQSVK